MERTIKILLVDDDELVLEMTNSILELHGYLSLPAREANKALRAFQESGFDLLLTDFNMPGKNGVELAVKCREINPTLPVMFLSGNIEDAREEAKRRGIEEDERTHFVRKPVEDWQKISLTIKNLAFP